MSDNMKRIMIITCILFFLLFSIGSVCAEDIENETGTLKHDSVEIDDLTIGIEEKTFKDLQDQIDKAENNGILNLTDNFKYDSKTDGDKYINGCVVDKNLTMIGKNTYIDGSNLTRGLSIASNCQVILKNITFKNGYSKNSGAGVLVSDNSNLTVDHCTFMNNKVYNSDGGAICGGETTNIEVHNTLFDKNTAVRETNLEWKAFKCGMGSAICQHIDSVLKLYDCIFNANNGYLTTILVISYDDDRDLNKPSRLYMDNCLFENNTARSNGAIYLDELGYGEIYNSTFRKNTVTEKRGIVVLDAAYSALVKNCLFEENSVIRGGGIYIGVFDEKYNSNVTISDCNFTNNKASEYAGAVYANHGDTKVFNCNLINNTCSEKGGAIYVKLESLRIYDSYFENNKAQYGGGVSSRANYTLINNSTFIRNSASMKGGGVYSKMENISSADCRYASNTAPKGADVYGVFNVEVLESSLYFGDTVYKIRLTSPLNMPVSQPIKVKFTGTSSYTIDLITDSQGIATITPQLALGKYSISVTLDEGIVSPDPSDITIARTPVVLSVSKITTTYLSGKMLTIQVKNSKTQRGVAGAQLKIKVYTGSSYKTYTVTTDIYGVARFDASKLSVGNHNIEITAANKNIKLTKVSSSIKINKAKAKLTAPKKVKRPSKIKIKVLNKASGKTIKNTKFKVKIYTGKYYRTVYMKTNAKGILKIKTKNMSKGKHKIAVVLKNANYKINNKVTVKVK